MPSGDLLHGVRVLVVDDDPDVLQLLSFALDACGASVNGATCVREALTAIRAAHPHAVVTDIRMPEEDGFALLRHVKQLDAEVKPKAVIAVTGEVPQMKAQGLDAGFAAFLMKPVDPWSVCWTVADHVR